MSDSTKTPSDELLARIKTAVRNELAGEWNVSIEPEGASPLFHLHKIDSDTAEFHRKHPADEPAFDLETDPAAGVPDCSH